MLEETDDFHTFYALIETQGYVMICMIQELQVLPLFNSKPPMSASNLQEFVIKLHRFLPWDLGSKLIECQ